MIQLQIIQPCTYDPDPNEMDHSFKSWLSKGVTTFYSLTDKGKLKDFENLRREYHLEKHDFFRHLQIRHYFEHNIRIKTDLDDPILKIFRVLTNKKREREKVTL